MKKKLFFVFIMIANIAFAQKQPNIIFILADDLGYADVACYGQQKIKTPNIDALAKSGIKFTQFYSGSTVCAPARTTFMTGLHTGHTPVRGNKTLEPEGQVPLPDSVITIAMKLKEAGYNTGAFGKWSLGFITTSGDPAKKGFDNFYGYNCQTLAHGYYPDHLWENHNRIDFSDNLYKHNVYSADLIHSKAMAFINQQNNQTPFFLYLPYTLPHADLTVPHDSVYEYYVHLFNEQPAIIKNKKDTIGKPFEPYRHAVYAAMVARLDKYVGEIVALINKKGLAENTLIIFASDNGPHKEDGGDPEFFNNAGIFRGIKRDLYEGGIREPLIISWKGKIKPNTESNHITALWDMYPTFEELAKINVTKNIDGISFLPTLIKNTQQKEHNYLYWELHESGGKQAVRWGKWKGVKLDVSTNKNVAIELYDLEKDPSEKNNVALQFPDVVKQIEKFMQEAHVKNNDWLLLADEN